MRQSPVRHERSSTSIDELLEHTARGAVLLELRGQHTRRDELTENADHDHRKAKGREDLVVLEVLDAEARALAIARNRRLTAREALQTRNLAAFAVVSVEVDPPSEVGDRARERRHLPIEDRHAASIAEHDVAESRVAP